MNTILIIGTIVAVLGVVIFMWLRARRIAGVTFQSDMTVDELFSIVKTTLSDLVKEESIVGLTELEIANSFKRKARISSALKNCVYGIDSAKVIVIDLIRTIISDYLEDEEAVLKVMNFSSMFLDVRIKFEILMYRYKIEHKRDALAVLIDKYNLDRTRHEIEDKTKPSYLVDEEDINSIYSNESITLSYAEMLDILAILLYQRYKGFGIVDTVSEMNINGFNFGTSGSILTALSTKEANKMNRAPASLWLYFRGKYIHMKFMNFGSEEEVRRVVQLISRYNSPGPLTEKRGYIVNTMHDKSRVLALRPPLAEYWAVFVRKFSLSDPSLKGLIYKDFVKDADVPFLMIKYLITGMMTIAFTGRQGSGKTTMLASVLEFADPRLNVRILEAVAEIYARELYPERNILSLQETSTVSITEAQDALKKSDSAITIIGEVATDELAANMIQLTQIASLFTLFSHHANTAEDLVYGLRNSLVNAKNYDPTTAEAQVLQVLQLNVHLDYDTAGIRYVDRITEIIPLAERQTYPKYDPNNPINSINELTREYYIRSTDRQKFITKDLIRYDHTTHTYHAVNIPSKDLIAKMMKQMPENERAGFYSFVERYWLSKVRT